MTYFILFFLDSGTPGIGYVLDLKKVLLVECLVYQLHLCYKTWKTKSMPRKEEFNHLYLHDSGQKNNVHKKGVVILLKVTIHIRANKFIIL